MKAAVIKEPGVVAVEEVPTPKPAAGEVLLKVEACALCGTDQRVLSGEKHVDVSIVGHEITGTVAFTDNHTCIHVCTDLNEELTAVNHRQACICSYFTGPIGHESTAEPLRDRTTPLSIAVEKTVHDPRTLSICQKLAAKTY